MRRRSKWITSGVLSLCTAACALWGAASLATVKGNAAEILLNQNQTATLTSGAKTLENVSFDPVIYTDEASNGMLTNAAERVDTSVLNVEKPVLFTADYLTTTTGRVDGTYDFVEYTVEYLEKKYVVTKIDEDGDSYIPVGGYVLSVPSGNAFTLAVGDEVALKLKTTTQSEDASGNPVYDTKEEKFPLVDRAVESESGKRIAVTNLNGNRTGKMVVYYDYDFGAKTGTNVFGTEMTVLYDEAQRGFYVKSFRGFGQGDDSGIEIPDGGFVLSAYGEGFRGRLLEDMRFSVGDKVSLKGFDYIRFGGEAVTWDYDYEYKDSTSATDEFNQNDGRWETSSSPYAAYRGENQTIIYQYGWSYNGASGTGTNVYGFEVAVDANGDVIERGVNVTEIPEGGFVVSGHGKGRDFVRSSIPLGAHVTIDNAKRMISITTSLNSFYTNTKTTVTEIVDNAERAVAQLYDVDGEAIGARTAQVRGDLATLETLKTYIEENLETWDGAEKEYQLMKYNAQKLKVEKVAYELLALTSESRPVAARATWHRPVEKTLAELTQTLDTYKEIGINLLFVETFYNGYSMFKSDYVEYHKDFPQKYGEYNDYLSAFVALAKARGIEVHAWVEDFYVGLNSQISLLTEHPDWIMYNAVYSKDEKLSFYQKNEGGDYIFIDPANPAVQDFLIAYYKELLTKHPDIAGLNLDYIRYPVSTEDEDTGYTAYAMKDFAKTLGLEKNLTATDIQKLILQFRQFVLKGGGANAYQKWCDYRMQKVTDFVERVYKEIKLEKNVLLSTAVFSSLEKNKQEKKQDWQTWFKKGWIDIATPMAYFDSSNEVLSGVNQMIVVAGSRCYYYTGLASSYRGLAAYENCYQIEASYLGGASGYVIFCSTQIIGHEDVQSMLSAGLNAKPAVLPHDSAANVMKAYFDRVIDRATRLYVPAGGMTAEQVTALQAKFNELLAMPCGTLDEMNALRKAVTALTKDSGIKPYAKGFSATRIQGAMSELAGILTTKTYALMEIVEDPAPTPEPTPTPNKKKDKGCGSAVGLSSVSLALGVAVLAVLKKKNKNA